MPTLAHLPHQVILPVFQRSGQIDDGILPVVIRRGREYQILGMMDPPAYGADRTLGVVTRSMHALIDMDMATVPTGIVTVSSVVFEGQSASVFVGPFELVSERDFTILGGAAAVAASLAGAISQLPGYTGLAAGVDVNVQGPLNAVCPAFLRFDADYRGGERNFTFTWPTYPGQLGATVSALQPMSAF